jgi:hypothetical protein
LNNQPRTRRPAQNVTTAPGPVTMDYVTAVIVVTVLGLLGLGIVINQLLRLKGWLKNSPPLPPPEEDPEDSEDTP